METLSASLVFCFVLKIFLIYLFIIIYLYLFIIFYIYLIFCFVWLFWRYSFDEGESWFSFTFSDVKLRIYGLLTEPGEKTTVFSIFGSLANGSHSWVVVQVNLTGVLGTFTFRTDFIRILWFRIVPQVQIYVISGANYVIVSDSDMILHLRLKFIFAVNWPLRLCESLCIKPDVLQKYLWKYKIEIGEY